MGIRVEQAASTTPTEEQSASTRGERFLSMLRYLPGLVLVVLAGVLYSRAGYGPFGDPAEREKPCTVSHCAHNATVVLVTGIATLILPRARHYRQERAV